MNVSEHRPCPVFRSSRIVGSCLIAILSLLLQGAGCGSNLPKTIPVKGRVSVNGKSPPGPGIVYFLPLKAAEGFPSRPGSGDFGADGTYSATTFEPNDGLMPGTYSIHLECWETPPNMEGKPVKSFIPDKYQDTATSGFQLEITTATRSKSLDFELTTH